MVVLLESRLWCCQWDGQSRAAIDLGIRGPDNGPYRPRLLSDRQSRPRTLSAGRSGQELESALSPSRREYRRAGRVDGRSDGQADTVVIGHHARPDLNHTDADGTDDVARGRREGVRGSVRRLKSGRWQARLPKDLDPWTRPLGDRFDTREEAVVELRRTVINRLGRLLLEDPTAPQEPGTAKPDGYRPETVSDMLENFLVENVDIATNTRSRYRSIIRRVISATPSTV